MIETYQIQNSSHKNLPIYRQCDLLSLPRSTFYYQSHSDDTYNQHIMRLIDEEYTRHPFRGVPGITWWLNNNMNEPVNHKRVERLMRLMGIASVAPGPHTSKPHPEHRKYPYLLRNLEISKPNQVWTADITYIRLNSCFMFLVCVMDWASRYVLSWELSNSMDTSFCMTALFRALEIGQPLVFNTDQGSQFTSLDWTDVLQQNRILISMDGRGRAFDNIFIERLWRTVKYEEVYLHDYPDGRVARISLGNYLDFYNTERPHSSLEMRTPKETYFA